MAKPYKIKRHKRIYRRSAGSIILRILIIAVSIALLFGIGWALFVPVSNWISNRQNQQDQVVIGDSEEQQSTEEKAPEEGTETASPEAAEKPAEEVKVATKTAFIPASTASNPQLFASALQKAKDAGYDSVMLELKDNEGAVNYAIDLGETPNANLLSGTTFDLKAAVTQIQEAGLNPVASLHTFRDHRYTSVNKAAATFYMGGGYLWMDNDPKRGGKAWLNPFSDQAQAYIKKIVDDACAAGFKTIVLDSVQFPEGYSLDKIDYKEHAGEDKNAFLKNYVNSMIDYAAQKGVELTARFPAPSMLGGENKMYFGSTETIAQTAAVVEITPSLFKGGLENEQISLPDPDADLYNTVKTVGNAVSHKLTNSKLIGFVNAAGMTPENLEACLRGASETGFTRCIVDDPAIYA